MSTPVTRKQAIKLADTIKRTARARAMYNLHEEGTTYKAIAVSYELSPTRVRDLVTRYARKHSLII